MDELLWGHGSGHVVGQDGQVGAFSWDGVALGQLPANLPDPVDVGLKPGGQGVYPLLDSVG